MRNGTGVRVAALWAAWVIAGTGLAPAQMGMGDEPAIPLPAGAAPAAVLPAPAAVARVRLAVRGFRPEADVNGFENTGPDASRNLSGNGDCFAISTFVSLFFERVEFDRAAAALQGPQAYRDLIEHVLGDAQGRFRIGGVANLVEFTDPARNPSGHFYFKLWCDLIQHAGQFVTHGPRTGVALVRAYPLPLRLASPVIADLAEARGVVGPGSVNLATVAAAEALVGRGRPAPICVFSTSGGHCIVAYQVEEFDDRYELLCHDVNDPPNARPRLALRRIVVAKAGGAMRVLTAADGAADPFYAEWNMIAVADPFRGDARRRFLGAIRNPGESDLVSRYVDAVAGANQDLATRIAGALGLARWGGRQIVTEAVWAAIDTGTTLVEAHRRLGRTVQAVAPAVANQVIPGSAPVVNTAIRAGQNTVDTFQAGVAGAGAMIPGARLPARVVVQGIDLLKWW